MNWMAATNAGHHLANLTPQNDNHTVQIKNNCYQFKSNGQSPVERAALHLLRPFLHTPDSRLSLGGLVPRTNLRVEMSVIHRNGQLEGRESVFCSRLDQPAIELANDPEQVQYIVGPHKYNGEICLSAPGCSQPVASGSNPALTDFGTTIRHCFWPSSETWRHSRSAAHEELFRRFLSNTTSSQILPTGHDQPFSLQSGGTHI